MREILIPLTLILLTGVCLIALFNTLIVLFPARIEYTRQMAETAPVRAFFLGLVNFLFLGALILGSMALGKNIHQIFLIPGLFILILLSIGITFGLGGVVQLTGNRLFPTLSPVRRTVWGTGMLYLACLTPFIGWFGLTFYIGWLGMGAFLLSFFKLKITTQT